MPTPPSPIITLTTDFGYADPYVGAVKGTILRVCPQARLVDVTHAVPAHQVLTGAFILASAAPYFPAGTLHLVIIDPGVGTDRAILVAQFGGQIFIFPDNGVITVIKEKLPLEGLVSVRNLSFLGGAEVSPTFHGRDVFAPLVGYIARGGEIGRLGPVPGTYRLLDLPTPETMPEQMLGCVIHVDRFGNLISNISRAEVYERLGGVGDLSVFCGDEEVGPIVGTYGARGIGEPVALFNSMGLLEVAVSQGRACDAFRAGLSTPISIRKREFLDA